LLAAHVNLGEANLLIAITIAVIKAVLIILFFMHLRWSTLLVRGFAGAALFWLAILFILTLSDYFSRSGVIGTMPPRA
jgi:cytochrome c oxidase subunit IV